MPRVAPFEYNGQDIIAHMLDLLQSIAQTHRDLFLVLHLFAMVIGLGGATYTDILLVRFLKDLRIDAKEADVIRTMSKAVFCGVVFALVSGFMLFAAEPEIIFAKPKFRAKMLIFAVIMVNGYMLHRVVLPRLIHFSFDTEHYLISKFLHLRHAGFIMGAISGISWYSVFLLGGFSNLALGFWHLLVGYLATLVVGIVIALMIEKKLKGASDEPL